MSICPVLPCGRRTRDPTTGECLRTLRGHTDAVCSLSAADGSRLVSASWDKTARVWLLDALGEDSGTLSHGPLRFAWLCSRRPLPGLLLLPDSCDHGWFVWGSEPVCLCRIDS